VLIGIASVQLGSVVAKGLFTTLGPSGTAFLRVGLAAVVLLAVWRPSLRGHPGRALLLALAFGVTTGVMNLAFYEALDRIPLGIAVTIEFIGPLGVAVAGSRRALDGLWVLLAASGIALLAPWGGIHLDLVGALFGLVAAACWATYIHLSARVGSAFPGGSGLALALGAGGLALLPVGVVGAGSALLDPHALVAAAALALLSAVIPYSVEIEALRTLPTRVFGVLMSLEPAVAALVGLIFLHQVLDARALLAILLVVAASLGASRATAHVPLDP
jgi:inner membrane transporter RhtA